jgi:hypothetical protein
MSRNRRPLLCTKEPCPKEPGAKELGSKHFTARQKVH